MAATPHELETQLADNYLDTAALGREVASLALLQALNDAKAGTLRDPAKTAMNAIIASGTALDKRLVLQNRPTVITEHRDPKQAAAALARRLGVTIEGTAEDITPVQTTAPTPLLPERASPNARVRARQDTPD